MCILLYSAVVNATKEADPTRSVTCVLAVDKHSDLAVRKKMRIFMHFLTFNAFLK